MSSLTTITVNLTNGEIATFEGEGIRVQEDFGILLIESKHRRLFRAHMPNISGYSQTVEIYPEEPDKTAGDCMNTSGPANAVEPETPIAQTKRWRRDLDAILQEMKKESSILAHNSEVVRHGASTMGVEEELFARCCSIQHLIESVMWCGMILKAVGTDNPYPKSYDPSSPVVEPVSGGLKL